ncbi:MAG: ATP-binding protein [Chthonomonadetes bacterium]|nr:ATP-binding protein [Chthonomonadetes bacterium]
MISRIQALNYKCLRYITQPLSHFHVLVGANASGKSTFLDVVAFMRDLLLEGIEYAVQQRSQTARELVWQQSEPYFELAVEMRLPMPVGDYTTARYEIRVSSEETLEVENFWLIRTENGLRRSSEEIPVLFAEEQSTSRALVTEHGKHSPAGYRKVMSRNPDGRVYVRSETTDWNFYLRPSRDRAGLTVVPEEEERFQASLWARQLLTEGVQILQLSAPAMRSPCRPDAPERFQPDGSNLPIVVDSLRSTHPQRYDRWLQHIRTVLPEVKEVKCAEREVDRYRYLIIETATGLRLPSWMLSDGTLRFLALTLLAYLPQPGAVYFVEEPENGVHPRALEAVYQSLSSVYDGQVLCATHSPLLLNLCRPDELLCFARTPSGATNIVRGDLHPQLQEWRANISLGDLLASGVLG